ncbi:proteasome assembly chaperone family protein [Frigoribacterium faeni]|uniref:PAC2 family protein n=1 Tax=Frigoribacterium faeni TaxID=145483 RepID=A0A7W3JHA7_9MICO|nr:PAC2 family protein [Frigoribacterium faeni]MBA8812778.1 hypothetical protein [Frigoribacterium faeni]BFF13901.1 PAC2 family protein [Microbacterium flavescens]GEK82404.1 hypothetical protein FFA01_07130 [Frigoribacterium faeni]
MHDPAGLYDLSSDASEVPDGLPLVAGLTGFADAGSAVSQLADYMLETLDHTLVASFDTDELLDYRARRPVFTFDHDHVSEVAVARLSLHLVHDDIGQPFLLLSGFEPDFQWNRFTAAVLQLVERYRVSTTTWVHSIPMPVPHTRPIGVTVSGNRADLIESLSVWKPVTQAPANALHLIEHRLGEEGHPTAGFVLLVPHYLADTEFPDAAVAALSSISAATGLIFPTDRLREEGREFLNKVEEQVHGNTELSRLVSTLEERHDTYMEGNPLPSPLTDQDGRVPTADALAAELEKFLARRSDGDPAS